MTAAEREALVERHTPLVRSIVRRYIGCGVEPDDLFQLGVIGLIKAIDNFDARRGVQFSTYAVPKIAGEIRRFLRDDGAVRVSRTVRERAASLERERLRLASESGREPTLSELAAAAGLSAEEAAVCLCAPLRVSSLDEPVGEDGAPLRELIAGENGEERLLERLDLRDALRALDDVERRVLLLRYWRDMTQQQAGALLGMSQVKVSRTEKRAVARLREMLL